MTYALPIKTALIIFPFLSIFITIPYIIYEYHHYGSINKLRTLIVYSFILYLMTMYFLVILPLPTKEEVINMKATTPQLIPLTFIKDIFEDITSLKQFNIIKILTMSSVYTVIFNVIMFMPLGIYLRYYYKCSLKKTVLLSFLISLFFELTQLTGLYYIYPKAYRTFDVDDLLINTLGGLLGYLIIKPMQKYLPTREDIDNKSLKKGKNVSSLRRITLFLGDIFTYSLITLLVSFLINNKYINILLAVLYYIIIPYLNHNQTIFGKIINVSLKVPNQRLLKITLRTIFIYLYYYGIIHIVIHLEVLLAKNIPSYISLIISLNTALIFLIFYIYSIIKVLKNKQLLYDKVLNIKYVSTIKSNNVE